MLLRCLQSIENLLPCKVRTILIVPTNEIHEFYKFVVNNFQQMEIIVVPEVMPKEVFERGSFVRKQYNDFFVDKFVPILLLKNIDYVMVFDADTEVVLPLTCQALFDDEGVTFVTEWEFDNVWVNYDSTIANDDRVRSFLGTPSTQEKFSLTESNFMSNFPVFLPIKKMQTIRQALMLYFNTTDIVDIFANKLEGYWSQFDIIAKLSLNLFEKKKKTYCT
jgi:hypothetical protein